MIDAGLSPEMLQKAGHLRVVQQSAALCFRVKQGRPEVLLITTRKSGRWILPKGWLMDGLTPSQTACREAWEEAGVKGKCATRVVGRFSHHKHRSKKGSVLCIVDVFPLLVQSTADNFPEYGQRKRKWYCPEKAAARVNSSELALLLRNIGAITH